MALPSFSVSAAGVILAAVAAYIIGMLWYGPFFGKLWMKLAGFTKKDLEKAKKSGMFGSYFLTFVSFIVLSLILAFFIRAVGAANIGEAIVIGVLVWIGFALTLTFGTVLWEKKPFELYALNNLFNLVMFVVAAAIIQALS